MKVKVCTQCSAQHYSVELCQGIDCVYFESSNPYGSRSHCRAYKEWVDEVEKCERCMDANHPHINAYYK